LSFKCAGCCGFLSHHLSICSVGIWRLTRACTRCGIAHMYTGSSISFLAHLQPLFTIFTIHYRYRCPSLLLAR
jgi:hypothetical protein